MCMGRALRLVSRRQASTFWKKLRSIASLARVSWLRAGVWGGAGAGLGGYGASSGWQGQRTGSEGAREACSARVRPGGERAAAHTHCSPYDIGLFQGCSRNMRRSWRGLYVFRASLQGAGLRGRSESSVGRGADAALCGLLLDMQHAACRLDVFVGSFSSAAGWLGSSLGDRSPPVHVLHAARAAGRPACHGSGGRPASSAAHFQQPRKEPSPALLGPSPAAQPQPRQAHGPRSPCPRPAAAHLMVMKFLSDFDILRPAMVSLPTCRK
jgi:hypothetical protein